MPGFATRRGVSLLVLCFAAFPWSPPPHAQTLDLAQTAQQRKIIEEHQKKQAQEAARQQAEMEAYWQSMLPKILAPAVPSPWLEKKEQFLVDLLARANPKILVVPPTVPEGSAGVDISARITIARQIARLVEAEAGDIPDPALVYRALGEPRSISVDEIRKRFSRIPEIPVEWIIVGTATHDRAGKMRVTLSKIPFRAPDGAAVAATFEQNGIAISDERPPALQFAGIAARAVRSLGYSDSPATVPRITKAARLILPKSPLEPSPEDGTLGGIWKQQLVGVLYVPLFGALPRPQERVFERTLAALIDTPKGAPDRTVLLARALLYLDRRLAAKKVLAGGEGTPEEKALSSYLMADLPGLEAASARIKRPAARLVSQLELLALRRASGMLSKSELNESLQALVVSLPQAWHAPVAFHVLGFDLWTSPDPSSVKPVLDRDFPVPGYSAEDLVRSKIALGASSMDENTEVELALSPLVHAQKWRMMNVSELCCRTGASTWTGFRRDQYLDLLETDADRLAMARLKFLSEIQGNPEMTLRLADRYDGALFAGGHPGVVHQRLMVAFEILRKGISPAQRLRIGSEAFEHARKLLTWESSQSVAAADAHSGRDSLFQTFLQAQGPHPRIFKSLPPLGREQDFPLRNLWAEHLGAIGSLSPDRLEIEMRASRSACENTVRLIRSCLAYLDKLKNKNRTEERDEAIRTLLEPRFQGNPWRYTLLATEKEKAGDVDSARALLLEAIRLPNAPVTLYVALGRLLLEDGKFAEAARTYMSYPGLKNGKSNVVQMSNYAGEAGIALARRGVAVEARPLLELAAGNGDGSFASLQSAAQVTLEAHDFRSSLMVQQQSYQRYRQPETAAAIASIMFAVGQTEDAWSALRGVIPEAKDFAPYRAAALGMRMLAYDGTAMLMWRANVERQSGRDLSADWTTMDYLTGALFQVSTIDRDATGLGAVFETLKGGFMRMRPLDPSGWAPSISSVPKHYTVAYRAFRNGDHKRAAEAWEPLVKDFDSTAFPPKMGSAPDSFWGAMPYYALSLCKLGRVDEARHLPERLTPNGRPAGSPKTIAGADQWPMPVFERKLIAGITAALSGDHERARHLMRGAQGAMPSPGARLIPPEYAFVELLETLFKETGVAAYKDIALAFARGYQDFEPWTGWAYAFDAQYSSAGIEQLRSAALALKFDPKSTRLEKLPVELIERAREWLQKNDPFKVVEPPASRTIS